MMKSGFFIPLGVVLIIFGLSLDQTFAVIHGCESWVTCKHPYGWVMLLSVLGLVLLLGESYLFYKESRKKEVK